MNPSGKHRVVMLPGSVLPAEPAYSDLVGNLAAHADVVLKDLEVYRDQAPPADYSLDTEVAGVLGAAESRGWERFHLLGYSGGGSAALAVAAHHPDRLESLALLEPAWAGSWGWTPEHTALWEAFEALTSLPPEEFMQGFMRLAVRPGVELSPRSGPPPPWMATRPAGIRAFLQTFRTYQLDRAALASFSRPVYFALGGLSNPDQYAEIATRLAGVFPDFTLETFDQRHHFEPPHRFEPERLAASLLQHWRRARL